MAKQPQYKKILNHPDREELLAKLGIGLPIQDIHEWLKNKYSAIDEQKFVITESALKNFKNNYLDFYNTILQDTQKIKSSKNEDTQDIQLTLNNSSAYRDLMVKNAEDMLDVRTTVTNLCRAIENRFAVIYDAAFADPDNIDIRKERIINELGNTLGVLLEKYYRFTEAPADQVIQHNIQLTVMDNHIAALQESVRATLAEISVEASLLFLEKFNERMAALKAPQEKSEKTLSLEHQKAEVEILSQTISEKLLQNP